ncbi:MAG TPA: hypothetical protein VMV47_14310 [Bacteroidales bacterium]|nr:hypothetical protein [Bacteroidales bacterium]
MENKSRRHFVKTSAIGTLGLGLNGTAPVFRQFIEGERIAIKSSGLAKNNPVFIPHKAASWWCGIEDLQWSQKKIVDRIKRRAEAFSKAGIDTAINFGFHIRFDFSNYFGQLHGYYANVCNELHKYDIKFMDHYSCNHVERPRGEAEFRKLHKEQRHHTLLFHDPIAAETAQYEGYFFKDICEVDLRDGSRGYAAQYQMEAFCHNNPDFLYMHGKYLRRLMKEVPIDIIEVDDMCDYAGLATCGCIHCRDRFKRDYGHEIPAFGEKSFWGDTSKPMLYWGNYDNPAFRDWVRMKIDIVADHVKLVKSIVGEIPLLTCCSSTGPIVLNSIALNLERMAPYLDMFMLENVGTNIRSADWIKMDAEALQQKDIAIKRGNAPAIALSYTIYEKGGYLGWALSRFWGVANWASTLNQRLEEDPADAMEIEEIISPVNIWEKKYSDIDYRSCKDLAELRLVSSSICRDNGYRYEDGTEQWTRVTAWSEELVKNNTGYRIVRSGELSDTESICAENTPLILDGLGCVSDSQFNAINKYLKKGGKGWLSLPFGTHDEKGFRRNKPLSEELIAKKYKNLVILESIHVSENIEKLIKKGIFKPAIRQVAGDKGWAVRVLMNENKPVLHFLNSAMVPVPHPSIKDNGGTPILKDIDSAIKNNLITYEVNTNRIPLSSLSLLSPELADHSGKIEIMASGKGYSIVKVNLEGVKVYAVGQ